MKYLVLNGCLPISYVSIVQDNSLLVHHTFSSKNCNESMFIEIKKILSIHSLNTLDFLAVCIGPGPFTSSRIAIMCIKTFGFTKNIPIITFKEPITLKNNELNEKPGHISHENTNQTLSTGGKQSNCLNMNDLDINSPENTLRAHNNHFKKLYLHLIEKAKNNDFTDPFELLPVYSKNP